MAASEEYLQKLQREANALRASNGRITTALIERLPDRPELGPEFQEMTEVMHTNRIAAERIDSQILWHRHDNGEPVAAWPATKPWRD